LKLLNQALPPQTVHATKLKGLVLDWAGTTVDFGSLAPARTIDQLFTRWQVALTEEEIRQYMGLPKIEHIRNILALPRVSGEWEQLYGHTPTNADVDKIYAEFIPRQFSCLMEYADLIPGVVQAVERFRERGLKIGSTTGYTRAMLDMLVDSSVEAGYKPDCSLTPEEVGVGRPYPYMMYECAVRMQVWPLSAIAKVGDTPVDVQEGLNAGSWSIGVAGTGNAIGLSLAEFEALAAAEKRSRLDAARADLAAAGAHYVIDTFDQLDAVLDDIDLRLQSAEVAAGEGN
jgi:phosphonoacetaldehyde hydrolase